MSIFEAVVDSTVVLGALGAGCILGGTLTAYLVYGSRCRGHHVYDPFMIPEEDDEDLVEIDVPVNRSHKEA